MGPPQTVATYVYIGNLHAMRQMRDDLPHRCVQIAAILQQVAGDAGARGRDDKPGKGRRGHRQDVISRAIEGPAQYRQLGGIAVAAGAGYDYRQRCGLFLRREPDAQSTVEPEYRRYRLRPWERDVDLLQRHCLGHRGDVLRWRAVNRGA